jgi:hypothetical protein
MSLDATLCRSSEVLERPAFRSAVLVRCESSFADCGNQTWSLAQDDGRPLCQKDAFHRMGLGRYMVDSCKILPATATRRGASVHCVAIISENHP